MAKFEGTIQEYHDFIGPRIRNKINSLTRSNKKEQNGKCQHCGKKAELQSAHKYGYERRKIIEKVLEAYQINDELVSCDLGETENKILEAHRPIEDTFLFLCPACHHKYDAENKTKLPNNKKNAPPKSSKGKRQADMEMSDDQLKRNIQSVGKGCFVNYFEKFRDLEQSPEDLVDLLVREKGYEKTASRTRVNCSRRIIEAGRAKEVLLDITKSTVLKDPIKAKALELLLEYYP